MKKEHTVENKYVTSSFFHNEIKKKSIERNAEKYSLILFYIFSTNYNLNLHLKMRYQILLIITISFISCEKEVSEKNYAMIQTDYFVIFSLNDNENKL